MPDLVVESIVNVPVPSNCFVIYKYRSHYCIVIDPGSKDSSLLGNYLIANQLIPNYVILTHEHFDHIWGVNFLRSKYKSQIITTKATSLNIQSAKKNLSVFYNADEFSTNEADVIIEEDCVLDLNGISVKLIKTPGHTLGGLTVKIGKDLFVGDLIIKDTPPILKLPGASILDYKSSLYKLSKLCLGNDMVIKCGHGKDIIINKENYDKIFGFAGDN